MPLRQPRIRGLYCSLRVRSRKANGLLSTTSPAGHAHDLLAMRCAQSAGSIEKFRPLGDFRKPRAPRASYLAWGRVSSSRRRCGCGLQRSDVGTTAVLWREPLNVFLRFSWCTGPAALNERCIDIESGESPVANRHLLILRVASLSVSRLKAYSRHSNAGC